jgi:site-specific DNA-cytosine methylase
MDKVILDLCAGTGAWSQPYEDAGYTVIRVDLPTDVRLLPHPRAAHGILAAPPCTYFCRMRMCRGRPTDDQFREGLSVVDACLRIIQVCRPQWWALENPQGYLHHWLGQPKLKFHPWEYGDPWTKRTWLWGTFTIPKKRPVASAGPWVNSRTGHPLGKKGFARTASERSQTPPGFAQAFFEANP